MSNFVPSCRVCQVSYIKPDFGCKRCLPAKKYMRWPEMAVQTEKLITRNLNVVQAQLAKVEKHAFEDDVLPDKDDTTVLKQLTESVTKLSGEMRQLAKVSTSANLSAEEKDRRAIDYLCGRTKAKMREAINILQEVLDSREKGAAKDDD